jgi:hypothetical protein
VDELVLMRRRQEEITKKAASCEAAGKNELKLERP